ncbi:MAG TPA: ABC transporter permease [Blastocatellia bacterium]|nr:ABC transporter permease [Blastocatellia bacterium]
MPYELFIALRYLRAKRRQAAVSVITAIAVAGITLGVAALIIAQALITGFRADVQDKILQGTAHINLLKDDNSGIENYRELVERVRAAPGVSAASATIYAQVLLSAHGRQEYSVLKGVDLSSPREANEVFSTVIAGDPGRLKPAPSNQPPDQTPKEESGEAASEGIILGKQLAQSMALRVDDVVTAISSYTRLTPAGLQPRPRYTRFRVAGVFSSGLYEYDAKWAYIALSAAQNVKGSGDATEVIQMKVADIYAVKEIGERVRAIAGPGFVTNDWQELNRPLYAALQLQHRVVYVFFALLIAIAALNIITTLTMMVIEKNRDIAILRAQGSTPRSIRRIFMLQGLVIGLIGAASGLLLGLGLGWVANHYQLISIPAEIYSISHITLKVKWADCATVAILAVVICLLATIYPARMAARLMPVEALRHD